MHDEVDVLSMSLGSRDVRFIETIEFDGIFIGTFHVVAHGILVICAVGNRGLRTQTV